MMQELKRTTAVNIGFNGMAVLTVSALQFATNIILARILLPEDYGIVGFALIFVNFMTYFSDFGIGTALIQKADAEDDLLYTGFALKILFSIVAFLVVFSIAPLSRFFNESKEITSAIQMLSLGFLISIFAFLPQVTLMRELRYRELSYPLVIGAVVSSISAIALAYSGFGFRSIIAGYLVNSVGVAVVLNITRPVRFRLRYGREQARHLLRFGSHLLLPGMITFIILNADNFAIGAIRGIEQLGYYAMAFNWGTLVCILLAGIVHQVLFPTFSKLQHDLKAMKIAYLESLRYVAFIAVPFNFFLLLLGREFLYHLLGGNTERWLPALLTLQVLCIYGVFRALLEPLANVITGIGKPRLYIKATLLAAVMQLALIFPAIKYAGIVGVAMLVAVSYVSQYFIYLPILRREIDVSITEVLGTVRPALLAFLASMPIVVLLKIRFESSLPVMAVEILIGGAGYFVIYGLLTKWQIVKEMREIVR